MMGNALMQVAAFFALLFAFAWPLGRYMARIYQGDIVPWMRWMRPFERLLYRTAGVREDDDMPWTHYAASVLVFGLLGVLALYGLQRLQAVLPFNPEHRAGISPDLAFNTAASFVTNTNWQSYAGEVSMGYLVQMLGLTVQSFVSAATGMAVVVALIRAFGRKMATGIGNFWVDMVRSVLYVLLPLSLLVALALVSQGVVQNMSPYASAQLTQSVTYTVPAADTKAAATTAAAVQTAPATVTVTTQTIPMGPAASQVAIKHLGTNGGGFFNANSAHPLGFCFGQMVGQRRQGLALLAAMTVILLAMLSVVMWAEHSGNPLLAQWGASLQGSELAPGGNMEGKELRFGITASALFVAVTTAVSCGAVNAMHDSLTPLGGMAAMWLIQLGEVVFGGAGSGLYGMLVFAMLAVFVAGLMIGRTPEYLGKKIGAFEVKMASVAILATPLAALFGTALSVVLDVGRAGIANPGAHGFSEILYAFSSAANNNGSAFAGLAANTPYYNTALALAMLWGRYLIMVAVLAIAGALAAKKTVPPSAGTLPTHGPLFVLLLVITVVVVGALTFLPALALGPVVEHLQMLAGR